MTILSFLEILILDHGTAAVDLPTTISKVESPFGHRGRFRVTCGRVPFLLFLPPLAPKLRPGRRLRSFGCRPGVGPASAGIPNCTVLRLARDPFSSISLVFIIL